MSGFTDNCPEFDKYVTTRLAGRYPNHLELLASIPEEGLSHQRSTRERWQQTIDGILRQTPFFGKPPRICVGFVGSATFNAFAARDDAAQTYFAGVPHFTPVWLHLVFHRLMNEPQALPYIGNAAAEVNQGLNRINLLTLNTDSLDIRAIMGSPARDATRVAFAQFASLMGMNFLLLHELSHILLGHVGHLGQPAAAGSEVFAEDEPNTSRVKISGFEAMEFQADDYAISHMINSILAKRAELFQEGVRPPPDSQFVREPKIVMYATTASIYLVFRIFHQLRDGGPVDLDHLTSAGHPHPVVRMGSMVSRLCGQAMQHAIGDSDLIADSIIRAVDEIENALSAVSAAGTVTNLRGLLFDDRVRKHVFSLLERAERLPFRPLF